MKKRKPVIGIVAKPNIFCDDEKFMQQIVYDNVRNAVLKNGGLTVAVLPIQQEEQICDGTYDIVFSKEMLDDLHDLVDRCDGIILQGGLVSTNYEVEIARYAIFKDIPLLGICAGFNNMVRALGGSVFTMSDTTHNCSDGSIVHKNLIQCDSLLFDILGATGVSVNSIHTTFTREEDIQNCEISAYSEDGYVEAIELKEKRFCLGVKWHPELMIGDFSMNRIFERFVQECGKM